MWIKNFDGDEDYAIQTWITVGRFYLSTILKISVQENTELENKVMYKLEDKLQKIELDALENGITLEDNDIRFSFICFVLLDQIFSSRGAKESEDMFIQLLLVAGKKFGKISIVNLDKYLTEKSDDAREIEYMGWLVLNHILCSLSSQIKEDGSEESISYLREELYKKNLKKLQDLNFDDLHISIRENELVT